MCVPCVYTQWCWYMYVLWPGKLEVEASSGLVCSKLCPVEWQLLFVLFVGTVVFPFVVLECL